MDHVWLPRRVYQRFRLGVSTVNYCDFLMTNKRIIILGSDITTNVELVKIKFKKYCTNINEKQILVHKIKINSTKSAKICFTIHMNLRRKIN